MDCSLLGLMGFLTPNRWIQSNALPPQSIATTIHYYNVVGAVFLATFRLSSHNLEKLGPASWFSCCTFDKGEMKNKLSTMLLNLLLEIKTSAHLPHLILYPTIILSVLPTTTFLQQLRKMRPQLHFFWVTVILLLRPRQSNHVTFGWREKSGRREEWRNGAFLRSGLFCLWREEKKVFVLLLCCTTGKRERKAGTKPIKPSHGTGYEVVS